MLPGETEALGQGDLLTATHANSWRAGKATGSRMAGSSRQHGEQGTTWGFLILFCEQQTLGADRRGAQGKHHRLVTRALTQESTLLKITLSDFQALYN